MHLLVSVLPNSPYVVIPNYQRSLRLPDTSVFVSHCLLLFDAALKLFVASFLFSHSTLSWSPYVCSVVV